jgi:hypothetical protein
MYLVGAAHPNKVGAQRLLERAVADGTRLVTDVEVLQEILHRYAAIDRREAIQPAFEALLGVVDEVFGIELPDAQRAKELLLGRPAMSTREALHVAVMERQGIEQIMTFDHGFDGVPGVTRAG